MIRPGSPLVIAERSVAVDDGAVLRVAVEDVNGESSVAIYLEADSARSPEPLVRVPPHATRELARALDRLAGELGLQP